MEDLNGNDTLQQTQNLTATLGESVSGTAIDFAGFTFNEAHQDNILSGTVSQTPTLVLKLYYTRNSYEAKWYNYDGSLLTTTSVPYGASVTAPANVATRKGYHFEGWKIPETVMTTAGVSFNAKDHGNWVANTYEVKFNGGTGSGSMNIQSFTYDKAATLSPNGFTNPGYIFAGWSNTENGDVLYLDQQEVLNLAESGSITLYAKWTLGAAVDYKVEYYGESLNGNGFAVIKTDRFSAPSGSIANASAITIDGFTFDSTHPNNLTSDSVKADGTLVLKLYYTRNSYTLTVDMAGDSMKQVLDGELTGFDLPKTTLTLKYGESIQLGNDIIAITEGNYPGYTFDGFSGLTDTMPSKNLTITAVWKPITITVTYYSGFNGPDVEPVSFSYAYGSTITSPDVTFTKEGYAIVGWLFAENPWYPQYPTMSQWPLVLVYGYYTLDAYGVFVEGSDRLDLTPYWSDNYTTIVYDSNGGTGKMENHLLDPYGGYQPLHQNTYTREGYRFVGWSQYPEGGDTDFIESGYFDPYSTTGQTVTLYAQWEKIET